MTNPLQGSDEETQERIAQVRARLSAAMAGPWRECGHDREACVCGLIWSVPVDTPVAKVLTHESVGMCGEGPTRESANANALFIASAPTDLAFLLSRVDSLESALREAQKDAERIDYLERCDFLTGYDDVGSTLIAHRKADGDLRKATDAAKTGADAGGATWTV